MCRQIGAHFENVDPRFICVRRRAICGDRLIARAQVWIKVEVDDRSRLLAAINPANSLRAGVGETIEIDFQIDLV